MRHHGHTAGFRYVLRGSRKVLGSRNARGAAVGRGMKGALTWLSKRHRMRWNEDNGVTILDKQSASLDSTVGQ